MSDFSKPSHEKRPDTSKNGLLKRNQLAVKHDVKERGKSVLSRLSAKKTDPSSN